MIDLTTYALLRKQITTAASGVSDVRAEGDELVFVLADGHEVRMAIPATEIRDAVVRDDVLVLTLEDDKEIIVDTTLTKSGQAADAKVTGEAVSQLKNDLNELGKIRESYNLFDKAEILIDKRVVAGSGKTYNDISDYQDLCVSPIIKVNPSGKYTSNYAVSGNSSRIYGYTSQGYYAGGIDGVKNSDGTYTYTIGSNMEYVRFNFTRLILDVDKYMFVEGETIPSEYEAYGERFIYDGYVKELDKKIDTNVEDIKNRIDGIEGKTSIAELSDKIDHAKVILGGFINGGVDGTVVTGSYNNLWYSDYTEVIGGKQYYYGGYVAPLYCAFYDKDKNYISGYGNTADNRLPNPFVVPDNACYFRFSCSTSSSSAPYNCWINIVNEAPSYTEDKYYDDSKMFMKAKVNNPCDYDGDSFSIFNKVICIGDSITEGTFNHNESGTMQYLVDGKYSYPTYLKKLSGVETVNKGMGGYTSVQWWNARQSDDFSGYDCAIINLGINDALQSVSSADTTTAFNNIISALKSANNNIKIFMATVVPAYSDGTSKFDSVNNTIKSVCEANDCYLIDLSLYSHVKKYTVSEAGHLTAFGYHRLAKDYISAISYIIDNNRNDFKWIQFTGTDYTYS